MVANRRSAGAAGRQPSAKADPGRRPWAKGKEGGSARPRSSGATPPREYTFYARYRRPPPRGWTKAVHSMCIPVAARGRAQHGGGAGVTSPAPPQGPPTGRLPKREELARLRWPPATSLRGTFRRTCPPGPARGKNERGRAEAMGGHVAVWRCPAGRGPAAAAQRASLWEAWVGGRAEPCPGPAAHQLGPVALGGPQAGARGQGKAWSFAKSRPASSPQLRRSGASGHGCVVRPT
eukprot:scaffold1156_cov394-Prasinococcus_capsulatus_cf.AAC.18